MVGDAWVRARPSGSSGPFFRASRRRKSTGVVPHAKSAHLFASANGRRRTPFGCGSIVRLRCGSHQVWRTVSKIDRATLLALAFADLCVRGGERAGLLGLTRPLATQGVVERFAEAIATDERLRGPSQAALPPALPAAPRSMVLLIGDFLSDPEDVARAVRAVSAEGAIGELMMIVDPIEETYPFSGNTEFLHPAGSLRMLTPRAQKLRDAYLARLAAHREAIRAICARSGWGMSIHRTDGSPAEILLALRMRLSAPDSGAGLRSA